jgi:hypothetical protein
MEGYLLRMLVAAGIYYFFKTKLKFKSKSEPNINGLHVAAILSCLSLISSHQRIYQSTEDFYFGVVIAFISYFCIGYVIGYVWRKLRPL